MTETQYMLDTNIASSAIRGSIPGLRDRLRTIPANNVCLSVVTEAELLRGILRKPEAVALGQAVRRFLQSINILCWESSTAEMYAWLRVNTEKSGLSLSTMDMLIAAQAAEAKAVLVTNDQALHRFKKWINVEDWAEA